MPQIVHNQAGALGEDAVAVATVFAAESGLETTTCLGISLFELLVRARWHRFQTG